MKIAIIDLGTNTFHMVILEAVGTQKAYREIARERIYVTLGEEEGLSDSCIPPEAVDRALGAMLTFRKLLDQHDVKKVYAVATSAMRNASNGADLVKQIAQQTDINVEIISGEKEASLIYWGVREAVKIVDETVLIMDIGGGSVEFIICNASQSLWQQSFEIGAQRLVDQFHQQDRIVPEDLGKMTTYLDEKLKPLFEATNTYRPTKLIGSSGAFATLISIYAAKEKIIIDPQATSYQLPLEKFQDLYRAIRYTSHEERLQIPGLSNQRVDMIVVSTSLIYFILNKTGIQELTTSTYSLKEGLFFHALKVLQAGTADTL